MSSARSSTFGPSPRSRVLAGAAAAPAFLLISFCQMPFNEGFDLTEHAFSYLSIGSTGTLQQLNFVALGLLTIVAATGLGSLLDGRTRTTASILLGLVGAGQVIAGIFTLDPSNGFPVGAPEGMPEQVSTHGNLHGVGFGLSMISWVVLLIVLARWLAGHGSTRWARASTASAVALLATAACLAAPFGTVMLYVVLSGVWLFTAALLYLLAQHRLPARRPAPDPATGPAPTPSAARMASSGDRTAG
jgi:hypothetical protein